MPRFSTVQEAIAQELRADIVAGRLAPGERLITEELATRFEVSPIPVREALSRLAAEGLVAIHSYRGATVTQLSIEEVRGIFLIRELLEAKAASLGARNLDEATQARLTSLMKHMREHTEDPQRWVTIDRSFHMTLYEASRQPRLVRLIGQLRDDIERYARLYVTLADNITQSMRWHQQILNACVSRDGDAARRATVAHLRETAALFTAELSATAPPSAKI
jgi:DNA-binding GntR family transcriptional regulator